METEHAGTRRTNWTFLTNHARVLVAIARDPGVRLRDLATLCDLTERTVQTIVTDLQAGGYLTRVRDGRRNRYEIAPGARFRHPAEADREIAGLLAYLATPMPLPEVPTLPGFDMTTGEPAAPSGASGPSGTSGPSVTPGPSGA
ncbi:helix-turn-helix domain-containing protein [Streptomyces sp. NPDC097619]|uniref:helix-turn-helix transcriptional regulator n=1 Tax=Streptomyces sp. NPDC097619 TaxID=3157228 RepID=UPI00331DB76C